MNWKMSKGYKQDIKNKRNTSGNKYVKHSELHSQFKK